MGASPCVAFCLDLDDLESAIQTELHLRTVLPTKDVAAGPTVGAVLQALAVLGELRLKFKHFGKLSFFTHKARFLNVTFHSH